MSIPLNTTILSGATIERLFSVGKDVLKLKRSGLTDQQFEMLVFLKGACNRSVVFNFLTLVASCIFFNSFLLYLQSVLYFQRVLIISFQPVFCCSLKS